MKRYILALMCCVAAGIMYADCTTINGSPVTISRWGSAYVAPANEMECWIVNLRKQGTVKIAYQIDLELINTLDQVIIYELDAYNNVVSTIADFWATSLSDSIFVHSSSGKFKVEFWGFNGNCDGLYNGFQIKFESMPHCDVISHDLYVFGNLGVGTTNPQYNMDVAGTIRANEIVVNTTGADFVFADDYQLRPLSEVKTFIQENKHLPEIKSAQEMQENGVGINELQTQLLQKIEELTLYILQQEERIRLQEERIDALEKK